MTPTVAVPRSTGLLPVRWLAGIAAVGSLAAPAWAETVYLAPDAFVAQAFGESSAPEQRTLWLTPEVRAHAARLLGRDPGVPRVRYWIAGSRTAWILEEIGKEEPITAGFAVDGGRLRSVQILVYRESRGWEVRYPAFTRQFDSATLDGDALSNRIDNISGATLSVGAVSRMARLALYFHSQVAA